tara:strand:- start:106 stop:1608 length:1503 start_codon:yes stop_codon:yes gene_type:complete
MEKEDLQNLVTHLEENLRASVKTRVKFIDPRGFRKRILTKQNHVVYGRRGAGKSLLVTSLKNENDLIPVYVNLDDYKDITFPNILIHTLSEILTQLHDTSKQRKRFGSFFARGRIRKKIDSLKKALKEPDAGTRGEKTTSSSKKDNSIELAKGPVTGKSGESLGYSKEVERTIPENKLDDLRKHLGDYKHIILELEKIIDDTPIYLILDDLYFIPKKIQPEFVDYLHRLTKGTNLFLKIATIKHRSKLYRQSSGEFIGVELNHDIFDIDLDYTLDKFSILKDFMIGILKDAASTLNIDDSVEELFSGDGFSQLCLASGGVPRDFIRLFVNLGTKQIAGSITKIGKIEVNDSAIETYASKLESLKTDSPDERELLEQYLTNVKDYIYNHKRTNSFLIAKEEFEKNPYDGQAIKELVDLRLLHLVDSNISAAPSDGRRYEAYLLDVSLYDNSRPRNFEQIEPDAIDNKSRKDKLRASPRITIEILRNNQRKPVQTVLELSTE